MGYRQQFAVLLVWANFPEMRKRLSSQQINIDPILNSPNFLIHTINLSLGLCVIPSTIWNPNLARRDSNRRVLVKNKGSITLQIYRIRSAIQLDQSLYPRNCKGMFDLVYLHLEMSCPFRLSQGIGLPAALEQYRGHFPHRCPTPYQQSHEKSIINHSTSSSADQGQGIWIRPTHLDWCTNPKWWTSEP